MKQNINIEAEGNELVLKNEAGDYVIIPKKYRKEVQDMIKDGCHGCIDALVETLPVMEDYAQDGSLLPDWDKIKSYLNPKNWGVPDYTEYGSFDNAYEAARKAGEKEFMWNNQRKSTLNSGTASQQFHMYGNTNNQILSNADKKTKLSIMQDSYELGKLNPEYMDRRYYINNLAGNPSYAHPQVHPMKELAYNKDNNIINKVSLDKLMEEYRKQATFNIRPHYNSIKNTVYGNNKIAEESHGYRNEQEGSEIMAFIKSYIKYPYFTEREQLKGYYLKDHFEYDTHNIVQPILESYLDGEIEKEDIPKYIDILRSYNNAQNLNGIEALENLFIFMPFNEKSNKYKIQKLQKTLSEKGYKLPKSTKKDGTFDGIWGDETENALLEYQKSLQQNKSEQ